MSSMVDQQWIFLQHLAKLITWAADHGYVLTEGEGWRPPEMQKIYVSTGKSQTMLSKHLDRLAQDYNIFRNGVLLNSWEDIKPLGDYWESLDPLNTWGGDFNKNDKKDGFIDCPHFERSYK